jgi:hypothetical protein
VEQQRVDGRRGARRAERLALWRQPVVGRDEVRTERYQRGASEWRRGGVPRDDSVALAVRADGSGGQPAERSPTKARVDH